MLAGLIPIDLLVLGRGDRYRHVLDQGELRAATIVKWQRRWDESDKFLLTDITPWQQREDMGRWNTV